MSFYLLHRFGPADAPKFWKRPYSTENDAVASACALISAGESGEFVIEDEQSHVVADDTEIRERCVSN